MEFKEGSGWKCCFDPETGRYTAQIGGGPNCSLYEINREIYDRVDDPAIEWPTRLITEGRHLFMSVDDRCGPPYTVIFDDDYEKICPWSDAIVSGRTWDDDMTDAAVEIFASEENNREQRRTKRAQRKWKAGTFFHHIREASRERGETLAETIAWAADLGYAAAELDADDAEGAELLAENGLQVTSIYRNYSWQEKIDHAQMEDHVNMAIRFGAKRIMAIPGFYTEGGDKDAELAQMHEGMRQLAAIATEKGITLTIEDYDNAMSPIATMEGMATFLEAVPELKVALDTGNFIFSAQDILKAEEHFLPRIAHVHLKDRLWSKAGDGDSLTCIDGRVLYPCAVGDGDIPIREVLETLVKTNYEGYVVAEHFGSRSYADHMEQSIKNLRAGGWIA